MSGNTQLFTNIFDLGPPASSAKSNFQLPLQLLVAWDMVVVEVEGRQLAPMTWSIGVGQTFHNEEIRSSGWHHHDHRNEGQCRPTAATNSQCRPTMANKGWPRSTMANNGQHRPMTAKGQCRPMQAHKGQYRLLRMHHVSSPLSRYVSFSTLLIFIQI